MPVSLAPEFWVKKGRKMERQEVDEAIDQRPTTFVLVKWYGYVFSLFFLLYGGVNIILGVLDRDYTQTPKSLVFLIIGIIAKNYNYLP